MTSVIKEDFELPSKGKIYAKKFNPAVSLRSMTVEDEMKRLAHSQNPYKSMSEIIESCLIEKLPIPVYDLCLGDYTYLLHKLRVVTYGPDYNLRFTCPNCGDNETITVNLDEMPVNEYDESIKDLYTVKLPVTGYEVKLRFQTPRDLDRINREASKMREDFPDMVGDPTILLTLQSLIESIDGEAVDPILIKETLRKLPMRDTNVISKTATKLNSIIGIDTDLSITCSKCGVNVKTPFRYTNEFFGPTI
jgi:hypothetical protein